MDEDPTPRIVRQTEFLVKRIFIPIVGVVGILHEELFPPVDVELLVAYVAMMGLAGPAIIDNIRYGGYKPRGGDKNADHN